MAHIGRACACGYGVLCAMRVGDVCYIWLCIIAGWEHACVYMMTGWSSSMYDLMSVYMHVCVFSVFPHYIIIITVVQVITLGQ